MINVLIKWIKGFISSYVEVIYEYNCILKCDMIKKKSKYLYKFILLFYKKIGGKGVLVIFWMNEIYVRLLRLLILVVV